MHILVYSIYGRAGVLETESREDAFDTICSILDAEHPGHTFDDRIYDVRYSESQTGETKMFRYEETALIVDTNGDAAGRYNIILRHN